MKWLTLLACWAVLGCGIIYAIVHGLVPHLLTPDFFPKAQAREAQVAPLESTIASAGSAVRSGVARSEEKLAAR